MCCGQKRSELRNSQAQVTTRTSPQYVPSNSWAHPIQKQTPAEHTVRTVSPSHPGNMQTRSVQHPALRHALHAATTVRYLENSPIRVRGSVSGMYYEFSGSSPVQLVDARDASSLLNTRFFRLS